METRLAKLETRVETILPTLATKSDIAETKTAIASLESGLLKWLSAIFVSALSIAVAIMLFTLNRISPAQPQSAAQPPIVIYPQTAPQSIPQLPQQRAK